MRRNIDVLTRTATFIDDARGADASVNARLRAMAQGIPAGNFSFRGIIRAGTEDLHMTAIYDDAPSVRPVAVYCLYFGTGSERFEALRPALIRAQEIARFDQDVIILRLFKEGPQPGGGNRERETRT